MYAMYTVEYISLNWATFWGPFEVDQVIVLVGIININPKRGEFPIMLLMISQLAYLSQIIPRDEVFGMNRVSAPSHGICHKIWRIADATRDSHALQ